MVVDSNYKFHSVLVDPGNGKVLAFNLNPMYNMLMNGRMGMGIMGGGGIGMKAKMMGPHGLEMGVKHRGAIMRPGIVMARP